jgi:hypothetical protein
MAGTSLRRRGDGSRGQALAEFALVFPVLVLILLGFVDVARAAFAYNNLENAARSGTRVAAVNQIETSTGCSRDTPIVDLANPSWSIKACVISEAIGLNLADTDIDVAYANPPSEPSLGCDPGTPPLHVGCLVTVTVHYKLSPLTPLVGQMFPTVDMNTTSQSSIERVFP